MLDKLNIKQSRFTNLVSKFESFPKLKYFRELLFVNSPNNDQLDVDMRSAFKDKLWFVVFRKTPLLLSLHRTRLGISRSNIRK